MMLIEVRCHTNIDKFKREKWPTVMACRPVEGDRVEAESGAYLYVCGVTHAVGKKDNFDSDLAGKPFLKVELHSPYVNLSE